MNCDLLTCKYNKDGDCTSSDQGMCCSVSKREILLNVDPRQSVMVPIVKRHLYTVADIEAAKNNDGTADS